MSVLLYMLEAGAGLALFYGIFELLLRKETYFALNRFYLIAAAGLAFLVPALRLTSPFFTAAPAPAAPPLAHLPIHFGPSAPLGGLSGGATPGAGSALPVSFGDILLIVYAAGVLVCLGQRTALLLRLASFVRRGPVVRARGLKVVSVTEDFSPFSFLGYVFLNDRSIDEDERGRILAHESVHARQLHSLDLLFMELATALQWFNPFVWPYRKRLQETHEYLADAGVIAQGFGQAEYQLLLLERHVGAGVFEFVSNLRQSQIKRRILMLSKRKSRGPARLKPLLALPLTVLLALAFAEPRPAASAPGTAAQEKAAAVEKAAAEKVSVAKRKLEDLRATESSLIKTYAEAESLSQKRAVLDKLREILRAEEECDWIIAGTHGMAEASEDAVAENLRQQAITENLRQEALESADKDRFEDMKKAEELKLKQRLEALKIAEQEVKASMEKSQDARQRAEYEAKLAELRRTEEEVKAEAMRHEISWGNAARAIANLDKQLLSLKKQEEKLRQLLQTDPAAADRKKTEEALKKNLDQQQDLKLRLEKLKIKEAEPIR